jgi:hypothetical protein
MKKITLLLMCVTCFTLKAQISDYLTNLSTIVGVAKSGNTLYIGSIGNSKILSVDMSSPNPVPQDFITGVSFPTKFVVIGTDLYLTYAFSNLGKIDLTSSTPTITPVLTGLQQAFGLAVKDNFIYFSSRGFGNSGIFRFDYTATNPDTTLETLISGFDGTINDIAINGNDLYFADSGNSVVSKIDVTQANPTVENVVTTPIPLDVAIDNGFLYYSENYIKRINISETNPTPITIASGLTSIWDMLIDNEFYIVQQTAQRIANVDINNLLDPTSHPDYSNLLDVYNSLGGSNWSDNVNWLDTSLPIAMWTGVSLSNSGSVGGLNLPNNNLSGNLSDTLGNLTNLFSVNLSGNSLSGSIPFNSPTINLDISDNLFDFSDIEPYFSSGNYNSITYSPQRTTDIPEDITDAPGSNITLSINDTDINRNTQTSSLNNQYQWYQDNIPISEATSATYEILNAQETDSGIYFCRITNPILPGLVIDRAPITLFIDSALNITDSQESKFTLYPNPVKNWLTITANGLENATIEIYDLNGRLILERNATSNITSLNVENLKAGVYILTIKSNGITSQKRFIKQ